MKTDSFSFSRLTSLTAVGMLVGVVAACGFFPTERGHRRGPGFDDVPEPVPVGDAPDTASEGEPPSSGEEGSVGEEEAQPPVLGLFAGPVREPLFGALVDLADEAGLDGGHLALLQSLRELIGGHSTDVAAAHRELELVIADALRRGVLNEAAVEAALGGLVDASVNDIASQLETLEAFHSLLTRRERRRVAEALVAYLTELGVLGRGHHDGPPPAGGDPPEPNEDEGEDDGEDDDGGDDVGDAGEADDGADGDSGDDPSGGATDGDEDHEVSPGPDGKTPDEPEADEPEADDPEADEPPPWIGFPLPDFPWPSFPLPEIPGFDEFPWGDGRMAGGDDDVFLMADGPDSGDSAGDPERHRPRVHSPMVLLRRAGVHPRHDQVLALRRLARILQHHAEEDARQFRAEEREHVVTMLRAFASGRFDPHVSAVNGHIEGRIRRDVGRHLHWIRMLLDVLTLQQRAVLARFIEEHAGTLAGDSRPQPHPQGPDPVVGAPIPAPIPIPTPVPDEPLSHPRDLDDGS